MLVAVLAVRLYFMLRLSDDRRLIGDLTNGRGWRIVAWATALVVTLLALTMLAMLVNMGAEALGVNLFARMGALMRSGQPFRPESATPSTTCRWSTRNRISSGATDTHAAAASRWYCVP